MQKENTNILVKYTDISEQLIFAMSLDCRAKVTIQQARLTVLIRFTSFDVNFSLVATHYPHHCLVGDWLDEDLSRGVASGGALSPHSTSCSVSDLSRGYFLIHFVVFVQS